MRLKWPHITKKQFLQGLVMVAVSAATFGALKHLIGPSGTVFVNAENLAAIKDIRLLDPNWSGCEIISRKPLTINWKNSAIHINGKCRVPLYDGNKVKGILDDKKEFDVLLDTGNSGSVAVNDTFVIDKDVEFLPIPMGKGKAGVAHLCRLKIKDMTIVHPMCEVWGHLERRFFGRVEWRQKQINLGLRTLKQFRYVIIDQDKQEIEFSVKECFDSNDATGWSRYPMEIKNKQLQIEIPIAGQTRQVTFDTGTQHVMVLTQKRWNEISTNLKIVKRQKVKVPTPLVGLINGESVTVEHIVIGNRVISGLKIIVLPNDTINGENDFSLGMGFLKDSVVVLDFANGNLWVKNCAVL
jgi:hypothetical protein